MKLMITSLIWWCCLTLSTLNNVTVNGVFSDTIIDHHQHQYHQRTILFTRSSVPESWIRHSRADSHTQIEFLIALKQQNLSELESRFWQVSDPSHEEYQKFMSMQEIQQMIAPKEEDIQAVDEWLHSAHEGSSKLEIQSYGDAFRVKTTVQHAEKLFHTQFYNFHHLTSKAKVIRSFGEYSVPTHLRRIITLVSGISSFPSLTVTPLLPPPPPPPRTSPFARNQLRPSIALAQHSKHSRFSSNAASMDVTTGVPPQMLFLQYNISEPISPIPSSSQGVLEFGFSEMWFSPHDLAQLSEGLGYELQPISADHITGANNESQPDMEATLDIQLIESMNPAGESWFWLQDGADVWLYAWSLNFFNSTDVPLVMSMSLGWWEADQCNQLNHLGDCAQFGLTPLEYVERVNIEFQKIGLRGISLIAGSGDHGAMGAANDLCADPFFAPEFPASSPYVTAVGATQFVNVEWMSNAPPICDDAKLTCISSGYEESVSFNYSGFASGGGFSNISARPYYQDQVVDTYFQLNVSLPPSSYYNQLGRGIPDVAACGHNLITVLNGTADKTGGTSAASPIFAALIARLNAEVIASTGAPLGFLNPLLYSMSSASPSTFTDITVGDNTCTAFGCGQLFPNGVECTGFHATKGWDPVSGLGTPNYGAMLSYIQSLHQQRQ